MPRGGAHFSSEELAQVLSHYDIGVIHSAKPLTAGNRRAPKMVILADRGKFLVKRRPKGKDDLYRVAFAHAVQTHLAEASFPVTGIISTRDEDTTVLQLNNHIYELFSFVDGGRYDGSAECTIDAGRQLAHFHKYLRNFATQWKPLTASFHDATSVRRYLKTIAADKNKRAAKQQKLLRTTEALMTIYNRAAVNVNQLGFDSWKTQVVHGDWHPGNMLFSHSTRRIVAVLDFDSVKIAPAPTDLANGMLQFSIVGNRPNPADWPDYFDQAKLTQFISGYREVKKLKSNVLDGLPDLMIETMIAEAILPIAATGFFGNLSGHDFLKMIQRKAQWLNKNRKKLSQAIND